MFYGLYFWHIIYYFIYIYYLNSDTESSKYGKNVADCVCTDRFCKKAKQNVLNACNIEVR